VLNTGMRNAAGPTIESGTRKVLVLLPRWANHRRLMAAATDCAAAHRATLTVIGLAPCPPADHWFVYGAAHATHDTERAVHRALEAVPDDVRVTWSVVQTGLWSAVRGARDGAYDTVIVPRCCAGLVRRRLGRGALATVLPV
jgi:hypothetical protein